MTIKDNINIENPMISYVDIKQDKNKILNYFFNYGFIMVKDVPDFKETYQTFIEEAKNFIELSEQEKNSCKLSDYYQRGWSYGAEFFNGLADSHKGSYYALIPNKPEFNIWPNDNFKSAYLALGELIHKLGNKILKLIFSEVETKKLKDFAFGRMLYYAGIDKHIDSNAFWCGTHRDHGLLTGLTPEIYFKNGKIISKPAGSGLYIRGNPINTDDNVVLFQIGETLQLISNGRVKATEHYVKKAYNFVERFAFACFLELKDNAVLHSTDDAYNDRFHPGMSYLDWRNATYKKYHIKETVSPVTPIAIE